MDDKELLQWIYNRLVNVYGENPHSDYMLKLGRIITTYGMIKGPTHVNLREITDD